MSHDRQSHRRIESIKEIKALFGHHAVGLTVSRSEAAVRL
jgi:hypothetical protein